MYKVVIIGAGNISSGYDSLDTPFILTHAHAYIENKNTKLLGFYDINFSKAIEAGHKWNVNAFQCLEEIEEEIDIVSVCSPDEYHLDSVREAIKLSPKVIFLEKPLARRKEDALVLLDIAKDIPIFVNYSRRFVPAFQKLAKDIASGVYGVFQSGNGYYGKGFIHNGSHLLDLIHLLLGESINMNFIDSINDFYDNDITKSGILTLKSNQKIFISGSNCNYFTIFELDLLFEKGRIRILNSGESIEIYRVQNNEKYIGFKELSLVETIKTEIDFALAGAVTDICDYLAGYKKNITSSVEDAFKVMSYE